MKLQVLIRICLAATAFLLAAPATAQEDRWIFTVTPYLWLPNVNGTLKYSLPPGGGGSPEAETGPNDYLKNLSGALMLSGEARRRKWSIVSDLIYLDFNNEEGNVRSVDFGSSLVSTSGTTRSSLTGFQWLLAGGYTAVQSAQLMLDVIGGVRYFGIETTTNWQLTTTVTNPGGGPSFPASGSTTRRVDLWDAIIGIRGRIRFGEGPWFAPYHLDAGAGSSSLTWQGLLGVGYAFKWGDAVLAYRHLYYDQGGDKLFQNFEFSGPTLGASFRF
jgi:hypothetical protein